MFWRTRSVLWRFSENIGVIAMALENRCGGWCRLPGSRSIVPLEEIPATGTDEPWRDLKHGCKLKNGSHIRLLDIVRTCVLAGWGKGGFDENCEGGIIKFNGSKGEGLCSWSKAEKRRVILRGWKYRCWMEYGIFVHRGRSGISETQTTWSTQPFSAKCDKVKCTSFLMQMYRQRYVNQGQANGASLVRQFGWHG